MREAALPIATRVTPELQAGLREGDHPIDVPANGRITGQLRG
jgi:hypothetical protein